MVRLLNKESRIVWPRFKLDCSSEIGWSGAPPPVSLFDPNDMPCRFSDAVWLKRWLGRQVSVLTCRPECSRQDYLLFLLLLVSCDDRLRLLIVIRSNIDRSLLLTSPIFATKPTVGTDHFRRLLRFTAGLEDFARINAHHPRRHAFPELADNYLKRTCLYCFPKWTWSLKIQSGTVSSTALALSDLVSFFCMLVPVFTVFSFLSLLLRVWSFPWLKFFMKLDSIDI